MAPPCQSLMDYSLASQPLGGDSLLARKPSDTWSSESTVVPEESGGCGNCIIDFLHLRPHAVDAVVDDTTQAEDANVCSSMMEEEDNIMIDASMSEEDNRDYDVNIDTKKPPPASCQDQGQVEEAASPCYYPSTPKDHMENKKPSATTPPPLNHRRRDNTSCLDIITNDPPSLSTGSISVELHQQSSELSIPTLSRILPPESLPQSHLIRATTNDDYNDDDAPLLSLNSMSTIHANPNEAMMPPIPRIHLSMRQSSNQTSTSYANRVRSEGHRSRHSATQQTVEVTRQRQHTSGFVPIQQNTKQEGDDDDEER